MPRLIGRFAVRGELGRGGMGVVYRAEDPTLGRPVALKLLPPDVSRTFQAREQLLAEARAAAVLDHPNICTVYDVGESGEGELYLAMALYEGETLAARLERGPLTLADATEIAVQTAQGLRAAHDVGIVHRDIKPSNIMLTRGGLVKILDFGIARAVTDPDVAGSATPGTPRYMAPEQLNGAPDLDARVDAWALGVVLYEMVTGRAPFAGADTQAVVRAILHDDPSPVDTRVDELWTVRPVVLGLLEKDRDRRLTIAHFLDRGARVVLPAASAETPQPKSLVVLPFRYIGAEPDGEYFADGLTAEIITDLSKLHALRVTSWTSARRYRDSTLSAKDLARELDVHYMIEGTIQRAGRDLRATAHLVDATNDAELWSEKYAGTIDDVFDIQERVSVGVSRGLKVALARGSISAGARSIANPQAYDLYLRARGEIWSFTATGPRRAIVRIDQALALVGPNALLLATRAAALWQIVNTGAGALSNLAEAALTARGALELDPESAPANRVLALISAMQGESTAANQLIGRALAASPADPETLSSACFFYTLFGDGDRAVALGRRATELDPLYALHWSALAFALASIGRDDDAADAVYRAFDVDPSDLPTQVIAPFILYGRGDPRAVMDRLPSMTPPDRATAGGYAGLAFLTRLALVGDRARVLALLTPDVQAFLASGIHNALYAAEVCSLVGETGRALWFLQKSADLGLGCYPLLAKHSRSLAPLRSEPEFARILSQVEGAWRGRRQYSHRASAEAPRARFEAQ